MKKALRARITKAIGQVEKASETPGAYPFLPGIKRCLEAMLREPTRTAEERDQLSGGLGKLVTDDFSFSESELGQTLLKLADDYASSGE